MTSTDDAPTRFDSSPTADALPRADLASPAPDPPHHAGRPHHAGGSLFSEVVPALQRGGLRFLGAGVIPVVSFYIAFRLAGPLAGIITGMTVSLTVLGIQALRHRRLDPIVLVPMLVILAQGLLASLTGSIELYLAAPAVEAVIWGVVLIGSVVLRRPLVPLIARELGVIPARFTESVGLQRSLRLLTVAWGLAAFAKAGLRVYLLLLMLPIEEFLVAVTVSIAMLNVVMVGLSVGLPLLMVRRDARPA